MTPPELFREVVYRMLLETATVPVFKYLPGSADELPCLVVGRPRQFGTDADVSSMVRLVGDVVALGRRDNDDDAQAELDALGGYLLERFWAPPPVEGLVVLLDEVSSVTVDVAGLTIAAYTAAVTAHHRYC